MEEKQTRKGFQPFLTPIIWSNVIYMTLLHVGAVYALTLIPSLRIWTMFWTLLLYYFAGMGVTAGVHRLWAHRSYKANVPLRIILMVCNCMSGQNSIYNWARDHRVHHKYSETDADPHNSNRGFFFAHVGWLLLKKHPEVIRRGKSLDASDLMADPVVRFQKRYFPPLMVLFNILLPTLIPILWGESVWNAYFVSFMLRYVIVLNVTWAVNSFAHMFGNRPYDETIRPAENMMVSFGALGEGFHNYHHTFPFDYRTSEFGLRVNATALFIDTFSKIGWAYDLKSVSKDMILKRRMRTGTLKSQRMD